MFLCSIDWYLHEICIIINAGSNYVGVAKTKFTREFLIFLRNHFQNFIFCMHIFVYCTYNQQFYVFYIRGLKSEEQSLKCIKLLVKMSL